MRFNIFILTALFVFSATPSTTFSQNRVVVIPLIENEAIGNAQSEDVLEGKTFSSDEGSGQVGTMPIIPAGDIIPGTSDQTVPAGYHTGSGKVLGDTKLISVNILAGVDLFGVAGDSNVVNTHEATSPVNAAHMKTGDVAFVNGEKITGNGTTSLTDGSQTIARGYYEATRLSDVDGDFLTQNIISGITVFGITGAGQCLASDGIAAMVSTCSSRCASHPTVLTADCVVGCELAGAFVTDYIKCP